MSARKQGCGVHEGGQRRRHGLALFVALALAAILSSALVPLLHRHHAHDASSRSGSSIAAGHSSHGEGCSAGASSPDDGHAPGPSSPERDDESSCPICVFVKSGQSRGMILTPTPHTLALPAPVGGHCAAPERSPRSSERPATVSPRAPPRSIA